MLAQIRRGGIGLLAVVWGAGVYAQAPAESSVAVPTYSLEAVGVNDIVIPGGPVKKVTVASGDIITAKIFVRDWSPMGEKLRAYQIKIDDNSYATGDEGVVQPNEFQMRPDKDPNALIDDTDPQWVHKGRPTIPLTDTVSAGYRYLSVLLDPYDGPVSPQDGTKFSCGLLKLRPTPNAKGTFTLQLVEDPYTSSLLSTDNAEITPVEYERLTVTVSNDARWRKLLSSDPPSGAVDARRPKGAAAGRGAWDKIFLAFNCESSGVVPEDLVLEDGTSSPPKVKRIVGNGSNATLELDRAVRVGGWTTITHKASKSSSKIGCFPGDVNADGKADSQDVLTLIRALNGQETLAAYRSDVDGNGSLGPGDLLSLLELVTGRPGASAAGAGS